MTMALAFALVLAVGLALQPLLAKPNKNEKNTKIFTALGVLILLASGGVYYAVGTPVLVKTPALRLLLSWAVMVMRPLCPGETFEVLKTSRVWELKVRVMATSPLLMTFCTVISAGKKSVMTTPSAAPVPVLEKVRL